MLEIRRAVTGNSVGGNASDGDKRPVDIVPFEAWHLLHLDIQQEQWSVRPILNSEYGIALEQHGGGYTAFAGMDIIGCAGIVEFWPGRAQVWSLMSTKVAEHVIAIHRVVKRRIDGYTGRRLECVVDPLSMKAVVWAERLGFFFETDMPGYGVHGELMSMYVKVRR